MLAIKLKESIICQNSLMSEKRAVLGILGNDCERDLSLDVLSPESPGYLRMVQQLDDEFKMVSFAR
jgi:hypothetical protein